ncbi:MAG TPA: ATP-binding protein, partial [Coriobacteriia bacterium]
HEESVSYFADDAGNADFVVDSGDRQPLVIQVCASLGDPQTRTRELRGAEAAMTSLGVKEATVVTLHESGRFETPAGVIDAVPAWRWMLERDGV